MADSLLRQLFYKLIDNSLKHREKLGQIRIHFEEKNDRTDLIYEDDSVDISRDAKPKLLDKGYTRKGVNR